MNALHRPAAHRVVDVALPGREYSIHIGHGALGAISSLLPRVYSKLAIVTNETVAPLFLDRMREALDDAGANATIIAIPDGEKHKTIDTWSSILDRLLEARLDRKSAIVALGGGVVGDIAGFARRRISAGSRSSRCQRHCCRRSIRR